MTGAGESVITVDAADSVTVGTETYPDPRREPILVLRPSAEGKPISGTRGGSPGAAGLSVGLDDAGNAYVAGQFRGSCCFGETELGSASQALFLWKVGKLF